MSNKDDLVLRVSRKLNSLLQSRDNNELNKLIFSEKFSSNRFDLGDSASELQDTLTELLNSSPNSNNLKHLVREILFPYHKSYTPVQTYTRT